MNVTRSIPQRKAKPAICAEGTKRLFLLLQRLFSGANTLSPAPLPEGEGRKAR